MAKNQLLKTLNNVLKRKSWLHLRDELCEYVMQNQDLFAELSFRSGFKSVTFCAAAIVDPLQTDDRLDRVILHAAACAFDCRIHIAMPKGRVFIEEPPSDTHPRRVLHMRWQPYEFSVSPMYDLRASV